MSRVRRTEGGRKQSHEFRIRWRTGKRESTTTPRKSDLNQDLRSERHRLLERDVSFATEFPEAGVARDAKSRRVATT